MIAVEKAQGFPVSRACELLGVSRTGFWQWERRAPSQRQLSDAWLTEKIREIHTANRGVYGARRIHAELRMSRDIRVGKKRVARLMRQAGISGLVPKKHGRTTIRVAGVRVADDLVKRQFEPAAPNVLWFTDITYLRTWEGWLYLAAVQDAYSRRIVGWQMADHMRTELVANALQMAVSRRRPDPGPIHYGDQGSQFVSLGFGQACAKAGIARSMGSTGVCWDNAVAETFFATSKRNSFTGTPGPPDASSRPQSSNTSRASTTGNDGTPPSGCSPRQTTRQQPSADPLNRSKINQQQRLGNLEPDCSPNRVPSRPRTALAPARPGVEHRHSGRGDRTMIEHHLGLKGASVLSTRYLLLTRDAIDNVVRRSGSRLP
jgi:putative transposase